MRQGHRSSGRSAPNLFLLGAGFLAFVGLACASLPPVRAIRAARYYAAGTRALDRGANREAIVELELAASLMPNASEIHNHLGLAYWADERSAEAARELERAVELDCDNQAARVNLVRLRAEMQGDSRADRIEVDPSSMPGLPKARDADEDSMVAERSDLHGG
jgi:tetratricopeptide (TPR) repeat protein